MIIITTLYTQNKNLLTSPIRSLVRNGENNADVITIVIDRYYGGYDLSEFGFVMEGLTSMDTLSVQTLTVESSEDSVSLLWTVTSDFTAVSGSLKLTLKAMSSDQSVCIIFDGGEIEVAGKSSEDYLPTETGEQLLQQIEELIASFDGKIQTIAEQKVNSAIEECNIPSLVKNEIPDNIVTSDSVKTLITLTQEEYDALESTDSEAFYIILDE